MPAFPFVVIARIPAAAALDRVEKVVNDLAERQLVMQVNPGFVKIVHLNEYAALGLAQVHQRADIIVRGVDMGVHKGFLGPLNPGRVGVGGRIVDNLHLAVGQGQPILDARRRRDQVKVKLPLKPLGDDLHMQEPQKSAPEAETQRGRGFGFKTQRSVVEL